MKAVQSPHNLTVMLKHSICANNKTCAAGATPPIVPILFYRLHPESFLNITPMRNSLTLAASPFLLAAMLSGCATSQPVKTTLAPLPETVTSFGAVTDGDWLYVFGGHKGERHEYS